MKREQALSLGLEKTYALLGYTAATPEADSVAALCASWWRRTPRTIYGAAASKAPA